MPKPLDRIFQPNRTAFIPYVMAGDPDLQTTQDMLAHLARLGADAIELGVPYGDPLADGPSIAAAGMRALTSGTRVDDVLDLAQRAAHRSQAPIVLFTYYNPVLAYGESRFAQACADASVRGVIVPDLALEETAALRAFLAQRGVAMPLLVAPSTPPERAASIAANATGFIYLVSRLGVTGSRSSPDLAHLSEQVRSLRESTEKPIAVGFGVRTAHHVRSIGRLAGGVIVGSALIDSYAGLRGGEAVARAEAFVRPLVEAAHVGG